MAKKLKQLIGIRLQEARHQRGLTQEELAFKICKTAESISNIERGIQLPSIETLADLMRELGIPLAEFLSDIPGQKRVPADRLRMEAQLREIARSLSNHDLTTAIGLLEVLALRARQK